MTTPPTAAEIDTFMNSNSINGFTLNFLTMFASGKGQLSLYAVNDRVLWVVGYTDNGSNQHIESVAITDTGVAGAGDTDLEMASPAGSGGPFAGNGGSVFFGEGGDPPPGNAALWRPYLQWLVDSYGTIRLRGYLVPAVTGWPPAALDSTVQDWVNDTGNWPAAG